MKNQPEGFEGTGLGPTRDERRQAWNYYEVSKTDFAGEETPFFMTLGVDLFGPTNGTRALGQLTYNTRYTWARTLLKGRIIIPSAVSTIKNVTFLIVYALWSNVPAVPSISEILLPTPDPGFTLRNYPLCNQNDANASQYIILYRKNIPLFRQALTPRTGMEVHEIDLQLDLKNLPFRPGSGAGETWPRGGLFVFITSREIAGATNLAQVQLFSRTYWNDPPTN